MISGGSSSSSGHQTATATGQMPISSGAADEQRALLFFTDHDFRHKHVSEHRPIISNEMVDDSWQRAGYQIFIGSSFQGSQN